MNDPSADTPGTSTDHAQDEKPPAVVLQPQDVIRITKRFEKQRHEYYRNTLLDTQYDLVNKLNGIVGLLSQHDPHPSSSRSPAQHLDDFNTHLACFQSAAFANRNIAAQEAVDIFESVKKFKPLEKKVKRVKLTKKERRERELAAAAAAPSSSKADRSAQKEKAGSSKQAAAQQAEELPDTPLAVNRGKRRTAAFSAPEKPEKRPKKENGSIKKRTSNRLSKTPRINTKEDEEPTYCFCSRVSFGDMIGCDNDKCEIEWFHFECIGLTTKPKGKWFCPNCRHPDSARMPKGGRKEPDEKKESAT